MHSRASGKRVGDARERLAAMVLAAMMASAAMATSLQPDPATPDPASPQPGVVERFPPIPARSPGTPLTLSAPDASEALRCLALVRAWLDRGEVDGTGPTMGAACVTIRLDDQILGRAEATATPEGDGSQVLVSAARSAIEQALSRLAAPPDATAQQARLDMARNLLTVSVEVGGLPAPLEIESFEEASATISPGVVGLGARVGSGASAWSALVFPSAMVARGMDAGTALASVAADVLDQSDAGLAGAAAVRERGVRFLLFECVWAAEVGTDRAGLILARGGRVFETRDVSSGMLRDLGGRIAGALGEAGSGQGEAFDRALRAFALARWAGTPGVGDAARAAAWRERCLTWLTPSADPSGEFGMAPVTAAMWLMAESEVVAMAPGQAAPTEFGVVRGRAFEALVRGLGSAHEASPGVAALLAWAGAHRGGVLADAELVDRSGEALLGAYARTPAEEWVSLWPWAVWAELELARARQRVGEAEGGIERLATLREIRDQVWRHQIGATDVRAGDRDLVGGIVFTRGRGALPTWQSLRALGALATMLGDPRLTGAEEFPGQVLRMLASLRFLRQLCADEAVMSWSAGPAWGVRAHTWSGEQPEQGTAMGLLVISETLRSLEAVRAAREAAPGR